MKTTAFVGPINNGYVLLLLGEDEDEQMDVKLETLAKYMQEPVKEEDFLEIILSSEKEIIHVRKLVEETKKRKKEAISLTNWMMYGIYEDRENV